MKPPTIEDMNAMGRGVLEMTVLIEVPLQPKLVVGADGDLSVFSFQGGYSMAEMVMAMAPQIVDTADWLCLTTDGYNVATTIDQVALYEGVSLDERFQAGDDNISEVLMVHLVTASDWVLATHRYTRLGTDVAWGDTITASSEHGDPAPRVIQAMIDLLVHLAKDRN